MSKRSLWHLAPLYFYSTEIHLSSTEKHYAVGRATPWRIKAVYKLNGWYQIRYILPLRGYQSPKRRSKQVFIKTHWKLNGYFNLWNSIYLSSHYYHNKITDTVEIRPKNKSSYHHNILEMKWFLSPLKINEAHL